MLLAAGMGATAKVHVIAFGKWMAVQWFPGSATPGSAAKDKAITMRMRALVVDGRVKEYMLGAPHEVTERLFVVRRVFRVNDSLPEESAAALAVAARRLAAGRPHDGPSFGDQSAGVRRVLLGRQLVPRLRCLLRRGRRWQEDIRHGGAAQPAQAGAEEELSGRGVADDAAPDSACPAPAWQRAPVRVSFEPAGSRRGRRLPSAGMWWMW